MTGPDTRAESACQATTQNGTYTGRTMNIETILQIVCTALIAVCAQSLSSMKDDIREIRESFMEHISNHEIHFKPPSKASK